jgi:cell division protease FtsH
VDEIDAIAGKRHQSIHSHHETLNQLLNELDGFSARENVIFLAATNSLNVLDPALLRPGRFDRHILISLPNYQARREIIALCLRKRAVEKDVDPEELADMTQGLSGAEIVNIFREAVILSIRYEKKTINQEIIFEAHDRTLMGPALRSYTFSTQRKILVAYHEAGHALTSLAFPEVVEVKKITIVPR